MADPTSVDVLKSNLSHSSDNSKWNMRQLPAVPSAAVVGLQKAVKFQLRSRTWYLWRAAPKNLTRLNSSPRDVQRHQNSYRTWLLNNCGWRAIFNERRTQQAGSYSNDLREGRLSLSTRHETSVGHIIDGVVHLLGIETSAVVHNYKT